MDEVPTTRKSARAAEHSGQAEHLLFPRNSLILSRGAGPTCSGRFGRPHLRSVVLLQVAWRDQFVRNRSSLSKPPAVGFPSNYLDPATIDLNALQAFHIRALNPTAKEPMVQQWSAGVQRQTGAWLAEVDYVGTKSTHLDVIYDYNQPTIANGVSSGVAPYANFGQVEYTTPIGFGNYNGLQACLIRQMTKGLSVRAAYTYSRSLDNAPEELETNSGDPPFLGFWPSLDEREK